MPNLPTLTYRGQRWQLVSVSRTSDGFLLGSGVLLDDDGEQALDESGFPILHSFFLGGSR